LTARSEPLPRARLTGFGAREVLRRQLPVYSPLPFGAAWRAAGQSLGLQPDPRPRVAGLLRALYRADEALLLGSGTQALQLAIRRAVSIVGERCAVALPAFSCFDVATAAVGAGVRVALYDVDPSTLAPDLDSLTGTLAEGAQIVVVAPLYGIPVDWDAIEQCVGAFGAVAIEDAGQGHGAAWRGRPLGSLGRLSVLSFGRGKGWTAGKGGALLLRGEPADGCGAAVRPVHLAGELTVLGSAVAQAALGRPETYGVPAAIPWLHLGETRYHEPVAPRRMSRTAAGLLERTLPLATREIQARRTNAAALLASIPPGPRVQTVSTELGRTAGFLRLPVRLARGLGGFRDPELALRLGTAPSYPTTLGALAPVRGRLTRRDARWPGAEALVRELVTLPTHSLVSAAEREAIVRLLERY